jgi:hypothetical protein
LQGVS